LSDFEATIARIKRTDPASPALLNAQLAYGEFLLSEAQGPCTRRLVLAQEQLGSVQASHETRLMFPDGWARAADLEYRLHLLRAECGSQTDRRDDLLAAAAAARRAVKLYRNAFDYRSMAIMQFDVGVTLRRLGDNTAALAALQAVLDMDREFGLADDARQNYGLLLTWQGQPGGPARVAALMQDFPKRATTLRFAWHPSDAQVALEERRTFAEDDRLVHSHAAAAFERRIVAQPGGGWIVSYAHRLTRYDPGIWPSEPIPQKERLLLPPVRFPAVDFKVSATGELQGVTDSKAFAARLSARVDKLIRAGGPARDHQQDTMNEALDRASIALAPGLLEAGTAENYQLETAMWAGAKLEQGVWYQLSAPLSLPGMPEFVVSQRIEFAFTRMVPCTTGIAAHSCVEIVLHATPDKKSLDDVLADISEPDDRFVDYDASTDARIVVDPATLLPYAREEQIYWFASLGNGKGDALLESDHLVSTTKYGPH
jgi:tetratricopeptide (TPR) repeat protein